jgi:hypothetical protein
MKNKLISFLIPTRGRINYLRQTLNNIIDKFKDNLNDIEFILKIDIDDLETQEIIKEKFDVPVKFLISDRLEGYCSLTRFNSYLANLSDGYFLWSVNDDMSIIELSNLVEVLNQNKEVISIINEHDNSDFPIINYKIFEAWNRKLEFNITYSDSYINYIRKHLPEKNALRVNYSIEHPSHNIEFSFNNEIYNERKLQIQNLIEGEGDFRKGGTAIHYMERDIDKILKYISCNQ